MALTAGQITLTNLNDAKQYVLYLNGNVRTQIFDPNKGTYTPNFTSNNLRITPELYVSGGDGTNLLPSASVKSLNWYEGTQTDTPLAETDAGTTPSGLAYSLTSDPATTAAKTLAIKSNLANQTNQIFTCVVTYTETLTNFDIIVKASFEVIKVDSGVSGADAYFINLWTPKGDTIRNSAGRVEIQADMYKGSDKVTPIAFKWYIQNADATSENLGDADGGDGWELLTATNNHGVTGYTTFKISVPAGAIDGVKGFRCIATAPITGVKYSGVVIARDFQDPIMADILGSSVYKNGVGSAEFSAQLVQNGTIVPTTEFNFAWSLYKSDGELVKKYTSVTGDKITIPSADVKGTSNLIVDVSKKSIQGRIVSSGQKTLVNLNDIATSPTPPENPTDGMIWVNTSQEPFKFYIYRETTGEWEQTGPLNLSQLDPDAAQQVKDAYNGVTDLDSDSKLTRYERSVVRAEIANIVGRFLESNESMPTLEEIDASQLGQAYAIRKAARDIGVSSVNEFFVNFGNAYSALRNYLGDLTPKPWDISSADTLTIDSSQWDDAWNNYKLRYHLLNTEIQKRQQQYADQVGEGAVRDAIRAVSNTEEFETAPITSSSNIVIIDSPLTSVGLPEFHGRHFDGWIANGVDPANPPNEWVSNGNRIVPVTNPSFLAQGVLTIYGKFYGQGDYYDNLKWGKTGDLTKEKRWEDILIDGSYEWELAADKEGFKSLVSRSFADDVIGATVTGVKSTGELLTTTTEVTTIDQVQLNNDGDLYISIADGDTGWGETYSPSPEEMKAYFLGWKMCNGTFGSNYSGTGTKTWHPLKDTDLSRSVTVVPSDESFTINELSVNMYQILYCLATLVEVSVPFDGVLGLEMGINEVELRYPLGTPSIQSGYIKYALNLATITDNLKYIIPVLQRRISEAEQSITDDAIVNTVTSSVSYQLALASKANTDDLGNYATNDKLDDLSNDVDKKIKDTFDSIDFSPYVTQSQLDQTANDITAKFRAAGGMNLIKNSIGFSGIDFWTLTYPSNASTVSTISTLELDSLGFGSGFVFKPDGVNQGINQTVSVIEGQPYTLSWYLNKRTSGSTSAFRFWVQILEDDVVKMTLADNSTQLTTGFESQYFTYTPTSDNMTVRFIGYGSVDATLTGIMLTIGDVPLKWSLSTGEVYNTYVRMNLQGIRVSQLDADRNEIGYTAITPTEFAGFYDPDGTGNFEKIFYLNGEETVTKKLRAKDEITMGKVKILNIASSIRNGWAIVPNLE